MSKRDAASSSSSSLLSSSAAAAAANADQAPAAKRTRVVKRRTAQYISLTTHPHTGRPVPVKWGAKDPQDRGPIVGVDQPGGVRNAIGSHGGSYTIYKALSVATGSLDPSYRPDLTNTDPAFPIGPHPSWEGDRIVSLDPWGHLTNSAFAKQLADGMDVRPSIAVTKAHIDILEIKDAIAKGRLVPDGKILKATGQVVIGKAAVEPVWHLPGIAKRMGVSESELRRQLFQVRSPLVVYKSICTRSVHEPPSHLCRLSVQRLVCTSLV